MSKTFTNRPSASGVQRAGGRQEGDEVQQYGDSTRRPTVADRTQRRDAYTVIAPDEEKRKILQEKAAEEEQRFQQFRESNRLHHVSYVGTVGGDADTGATAAGPVDVNDHARPRRGVTNTQQPNLTPFEKSRQYRAAQRQREETEDTKKKQEQRLKAAANEDRERQRKERLDEDRKKKMNAFFGQFESKSKHSTVSREAAAAAGVTSNDSRKHETVQVDTETSCDDGSASSLDLLQSAFPHNSREELDELLMLCNGDVDSVLKMLSS